MSFWKKKKQNDKKIENQNEIELENQNEIELKNQLQIPSSKIYKEITEMLSKMKLPKPPEFKGACYVVTTSSTGQSEIGIKNLVNRLNTGSNPYIGCHSEFLRPLVLDPTIEHQTLTIEHQTLAKDINSKNTKSSIEEGNNSKCLAIKGPQQ